MDDGRKLVGQLQDIFSIPERRPDKSAERDAWRKLFADHYGLGFSAEVSLSNWSRLRAMTARVAPMDQCSIGGLRILRSKTDEHLGSRRTTILAAEIDHITVTSSAAYGQHTGAWLADQIDDPAAPWRLKNMAAQWEAGRRQQRSRRAPVVTAQKPAASAAVAALLAPRQRALAAYRSAMRALPIANGQGRIMGHVAFTRAGGFDVRKGGAANEPIAEAQSTRCLIPACEYDCAPVE
jgi:hypothetical protein